MSRQDYQYTGEHEWLRREAGDSAAIGITDYAQDLLGDIVYIDLPAPGTQLERGGKLGEIESVKAVSEIFAPVSGEVLEINGAVNDEPGLVNTSPYDGGWLVKIRLADITEMDGLMDAARYDAFVAELGGEAPA